MKSLLRAFILLILMTSATYADVSIGDNEGPQLAENDHINFVIDHINFGVDERISYITVDFMVSYRTFLGPEIIYTNLLIKRTSPFASFTIHKNNFLGHVEQSVKASKVYQVFFKSLDLLQGDFRIIDDDVESIEIIPIVTAYTSKNERVFQIDDSDIRPTSSIYMSMGNNWSGSEKHVLRSYLRDSSKDNDISFWLNRKLSGFSLYGKIYKKKGY